MSVVVRDGISLAYEESGDGSPPLVFVHGWMGNRSLFVRQARHFARQHRVVSIDLRGHGESDKPRGEYSVPQFADDVRFMIEQLGLVGAVAVGHSLGGSVVLQLATSRPCLVSAIVLIDPAPLVMPKEVRAALESVAAAEEAGTVEVRRRFVADHMFLPTSDPVLVRDVTEVVMAGPTHVAASAMRGLLAFDGAAAAGRCAVPALHLAAARPLNPPHLMSQALPGVVHGWTVGAGHFNMLEVPDQVNSMIEGFLQHHCA